jgi:hypothetical protein
VTAPPDGETQRQEAEGDRAVETGEPRAARGGPPAQGEVEAGQHQVQHGQRVGMAGPQDGASLGGVDERHAETQDERGRGLGAVPRREQRQHREQREVERRGTECQAELPGRVPGGEPARVERLGADEAEEVEAPPPAPPGGGHDAEVEHRQVREERRAGIAILAQDDGGQEPAETRQHGDGAHVLPDGKREAGRRHGREEPERGRESDQVVERVGGVAGEVEGPEPGGDHALGGSTGRRAMEAVAQRQEPRADREADRDAAPRADPVAVEGVLQEEPDADDQDEGPDAVQPARADPLLEVVHRPR